MPFPILFGTTVTTVLHYRADCDLDLGVHNEILKFADDTKLYGVVTDGTEAETLQSDLNLLTKWTDRLHG